MFFSSDFNDPSVSNTGNTSAVSSSMDGENSLKVLYTNADSLLNKMEKLNTLIEADKPDIIGTRSGIVKRS